MTFTQVRDRIRGHRVEARTMTRGFDDRKMGFEAKYHHDQETQFKITARRNKLLGLWAAEQIQIIGADAEAYAKDVVIADFDEPGDTDVERKVLADLNAKGVAVSAHRVRKEMDRLMEVAREQILAEGASDEPETLG